MISEKTKKIIQTHLQDKQFTACALGIQLYGQSPEYFTVGTSSLASDAKQIDSKSLFDIASLTKVVFTTTLAAKAFEAGRYLLEDTLQKWIPESFFQNYTVEALLLHQARFRPTVNFEYYCPNLHRNPKDDQQKTREIMNTISKSSISTSMNKTVYSDPGFILMAEILSVLFQETSETSWEKRIQEPMGLYSTKTKNQLNDSDLVVASDMQLKRGEIHDPDARYMDKLCGHAGLFSSVEDMVRFGMAWLADYLGENKNLKKETVHRFIDPYLGKDRALGWDLPSENSTAANISKSSIGHLGFTGTSLWVDLEKKCVVTLLTNRVIMGYGRDNKEELVEKLRLFNGFRREVHQSIWETGKI